MQCCILILYSSQAFAQAAFQANTIVDKEFLEGLPPSLRGELEDSNSTEKEEELEQLFRADTSLEKNKIILQKLKDQMEILQNRLDDQDSSNPKKLERFGERFFSTIQSSFMPINVPNIGSNYVVDVGDTFRLMITGKVKEDHEFIVQRDGSITIPNLGKLVVSGKSLSQVESDVATLIEASYMGTTHFLTLTKIRDIQVLLLGGIESPGIFTISGGSNLLGAINVAGGISKGGSYRKIELRRDGQTIEILDLYDILVFGNYQSGSALRSGDTIFVHPAAFQVPVTGGVNRPGIFEVLPTETAGQIISYAGGLSEGFVGHRNIYVKRVGLNNQSMANIPFDEMDEFILRPRDSVIVPNYRNILEPIKEVEISGMVSRPGKYNIFDGETLSELVKRAGGYKDGAYIFGGALFREEAIEMEKNFAQLNYSDTVNYLISNISKPNTNVNPAALDFLAEELRSRRYSGRIVTDFNTRTTEGNPVYDIRLQANDRIVIPPLNRVVYLFGDFKNPSNINYNPNLSIKDYLKLAGGLNDTSQNELIVIDPDGKTHVFTPGLFSSMKSVEIYPGSIIYAPRDVGRLSGVVYAATVSPILSSLALSLASLNSIKD
jgi:polysaccharide export outer membrane protein